MVTQEDDYPRQTIAIAIAQSRCWQKRSAGKADRGHTHACGYDLLSYTSLLNPNPKREF